LGTNLLRSSGGFEVRAGFVLCDDGEFAFCALFVVAYQDGVIYGRRFFGITTIPAGFSFHDLQRLR